MTENRCLFCKVPDRKTETRYICSYCVQLMLSSNQGDLARAHKRALKLRLIDKARAIESFLIEQECINDNKTKKLERNLSRKKPVRMARPTRNQIRSQSAVV